MVAAASFGVLPLGIVPDLGGHDADAAAGRDEGRGNRAGRNLVGHDGLEQRRPERGGGRVLGVPRNRAQAVDELLRISLGEDRVELAAVGIGNPQDDAGRVEQRRRPVEQRRQRARVDDAREVDAQRRDAGEVGGRERGPSGGPLCLAEYAGAMSRSRGRGAVSSDVA